MLSSNLSKLGLAFGISTASLIVPQRAEAVCNGVVDQYQNKFRVIADAMPNQLVYHDKELQLTDSFLFDGNYSALLKNSTGAYYYSDFENETFVKYELPLREKIGKELNCSGEVLSGLALPAISFFNKQISKINLDTKEGVKEAFRIRYQLIIILSHNLVGADFENKTMIIESREESHVQELDHHVAWMLNAAKLHPEYQWLADNAQILRSQLYTMRYNAMLEESRYTGSAQYLEREIVPVIVSELPKVLTILEQRVAHLKTLSETSAPHAHKQTTYYTTQMMPYLTYLGKSSEQIIKQGYRARTDKQLDPHATVMESYDRLHALLQSLIQLQGTPKNDVDRTNLLKLHVLAVRYMHNDMQGGRFDMASLGRHTPLNRPNFYSQISTLGEHEAYIKEHQHDKRTGQTDELLLGESKYLKQDAATSESLIAYVKHHTEGKMASINHNLKAMRAAEDIAIKALEQQDYTRFEEAAAIAFSVAGQYPNLHKEFAARISTLLIKQLGLIGHAQMDAGRKVRISHMDYFERGYTYTITSKKPFPGKRPITLSVVMVNHAMPLGSPEMMVDITLRPGEMVNVSTHSSLQVPFEADHSHEMKTVVPTTPRLYLSNFKMNSVNQG